MIIDRCFKNKDRVQKTSKISLAFRRCLITKLLKAQTELFSSDFEQTSLERFRYKKKYIKWSRLVCPKSQLNRSIFGHVRKPNYLSPIARYRMTEIQTVWNPNTKKFEFRTSAYCKCLKSENSWFCTSEKCLVMKWPNFNKF